MTDEDAPSLAPPPAGPPPADPPRSPTTEERARRGLVGAVAASTLALGGGFLALLVLMEHRPQFVGEGLRASRRDLVQDAPSVYLRRASDDVSVNERFHPPRSDVRWELDAQRERRGLRSVQRMEGAFRAEYELRNPWPEPAFAVFRCTHPRSEDSLGSGEPARASAITIDDGGRGRQINDVDAWVWTGRLEGDGSQTIVVEYRVPAVSSVAYRVERRPASPLAELDVAVAVDPWPSMRLASRDGPIAPVDGVARWERRDFLPGDRFEATLLAERTVYDALRQLFEIGPAISALFLLATAVLLVRRGRPKPTSLFALATAHGFFFPLVLYLSANVPFGWALGGALAVQCALLSGYVRRELSGARGLLVGALALLVYEVVPTLAVFGGWNRGMVLLLVGSVTLFVLLNPSPRSVARTASAAALLLALAMPASAQRSLASSASSAPSLGIAEYRMEVLGAYVDVSASLPVEAEEPHHAGLALFDRALYLSSVETPDFLRVVAGAERLDVVATGRGSASVRARYRAPVVDARDGRTVAVPLAAAPAGDVELVADVGDLGIEGGAVWSVERLPANGGDAPRFRYRLGVAGASELRLAWGRGGAPPSAAEREGAFGPPIEEARYLTLLGSDGGGQLIAHYRLGKAVADAFELELPPAARLVSAALDGRELAAVEVDGARVRLVLGSPPAGGAARDLRLRLELPRVELGYFGEEELALPATSVSTGRVTWSVALPEGFRVRITSGGLDRLPAEAAAAALEPFGRLGALLDPAATICMNRSLAPPGRVRCTLQYRQTLTW